MAPFALPRGSERRDETKKSLVMIWGSLIGGGTDDDKGRTDGGRLVHLSQTTYRERTTTYSGKNTVIQSDGRSDTTSNGSKGGGGGENTNQDDKGDADGNNGTSGKTGCGKFSIFCRGNRTSGNGKNNDGDASDKGDGKEKEEDREDDGRKNSSSRPTNKPESTTMISSIPGQTSLFLVSEPTQAPTPSFTPEVSATSMGSLSLEAPSSFTTSYVPQATYPDQAISAPEPIDAMTTPIPVTASTEAVIYPTKSTKVQTEVVRVTRASPTVWITSSSDALSSSSSGIPDVREQHNSTSSNANDPQTAKNNGVEATGTTFDKTDERVLISVGSIGGFVLVCFLIWTARKAIRRATQPQSKETGGTRGGIFSGLLAKTAIFKRREWQNLNDSSKALNHPSPVSERTEIVAPSESVGSLCSYEKVDDLLQQGYQPHTPGIQIQYQQPNPVHQHCGSPLPYATFANVVNPANLVDTRNLASATMYSHQPQQLSTFTNPSQNESLTTTAVSNGTRQIQYVSHYDPKYLLSPCSTFEGRGKRMSDISSLSSGFGDGDIIVPEQTLQPPQPAAIAYPSSPNGTMDRFSGISTQRGGQRDTLYTESSEDSPARFRSLNSWVAQQSGRARRGQERDETSYLASLPQLPCQPGVPGIHNPPVEQTFNLMRDDEKPRPVEEVIIRMQ